MKTDVAVKEDEIKRIQPTKNRGGEWVTFGVEEYRIPPLAFGALQEVQEKIGLLQGMTTAPTKEQMNVVVEIVYLAVKRNYPDIDMEELKDMIDLGNFNAVLQAVLGASGFRKVESGEA